jgi:hypothetical protein
VKFTNDTNESYAPFDGIFSFSGAGTYIKEDTGIMIKWTKQSGTASPSTSSGSSGSNRESSGEGRRSRQQ